MDEITVLQTTAGMKGIMFYDASGTWHALTFNGQKIESADKSDVIRFIMRANPVRRHFAFQYAD